MDIGKIEFGPDRFASGGAVKIEDLLRREVEGVERLITDGRMLTVGVSDDNMYVQHAHREAETVSKYVRFMHIARGFASMSKNPTSKVGSVALGPDFEVRSSGWNGAPRGCNADEDERFADRTERLYWTTHSEANAIAQAARIGASLKGCTLVVTHAPCMGCANLIVQAGIIRVINPIPEEPFATSWAADISRTRALFKECGVDHHEIDPQEEVK